MIPPRLDYYEELDENEEETGEGYWYVDIDGFWINCADMPDFALQICEALEKWGMKCFYEGLNLKEK